MYKSVSIVGRPNKKIKDLYQRTEVKTKLGFEVTGNNECGKVITKNSKTYKAIFGLL